MRILIDAPGVLVPPTFTAGWSHALLAAGWDVAVLPDHDHVHDVFYDFKPDAVLSAVPHSRPMEKCLAARPRVRVVRIEPRPAFDSILYRPGEVMPALACDLAFVAHWTPEKASLYKQFLDPVISRGFDVKLFGAGRVCPYPQHLGWLDDALLPGLYRSAGYCLDLGEGSTTERYYQIMGLGGVGVSNRAGEMQYGVETPEDLLDVLDGVVPPDTENRKRALVRCEGTYINRVAEAFSEAGLKKQSDKMLDLVRKTGGGIEA